MSNSKFCPILRGNNIETFRLYEALEVGTIPIYVRCEGDDSFWSLISSKLQLIQLDSWTQAKQFITFLLEHPEQAEKYRVVLHTNWIKWKNEIKQMCLVF